MRTWQIAAGAGAVVIASIYLFNASWLAPLPEGRPILIAQRGVHQVYNPKGVDNNTCTATRIPPPTHAFIDNTIPSIAAAFDDGADVVEIDIRQTKDGEFVLFHDFGLDCRTNGNGLVIAHTLGELKELDVGYGYTADGGRTYPLRGKGIGLMPSLQEALRAFPAKHFLIQLKDGDPQVADSLVQYLSARGIADWQRLSFFGNKMAVQRLAMLQPRARTWYDKKLVACTANYLVMGWIGYVPDSCRNGTIVVPIKLRYLMWGWPNRFLERMRGDNVMVLMVGDLGKSEFTRVDLPSQLRELPAKFDGAIWTDHIEAVGPAARSRWPAQP